jgi:hypothetical protein
VEKALASPQTWFELLALLVVVFTYIAYKKYVSNIELRSAWMAVMLGVMALEVIFVSPVYMTMALLLAILISAMMFAGWIFFS